MARNRSARVSDFHAFEPEFAHSLSYILCDESLIFLKRVGDKDKVQIRVGELF